MGNPKIISKSLASIVMNVAKIPPDLLKPMATMSAPGVCPTLEMSQFFTKSKGFNRKFFNMAVLEATLKFNVFEIVVVMKVKKGARIDHAHVMGEQNYIMPKFPTLGDYQYGSCQLIKNNDQTDLSYIMKSPQAYKDWKRNN